MALQPMMRTASVVTNRTGGLLPRLFTLTLPESMAVVFCYAHLPHDNFPLGSMASCVARTFLSNAAIERPALIFVQ